MILHQTQAKHLLGDGRQAETFQSNEAGGDLRVEESAGTQANLAQIWQILQTIMQQPHILNPGCNTDRSGNACVSIRKVPTSSRRICTRYGSAP